MFGPCPRSDPSRFKSGNSCYQYFLILILGSINKNLKTHFYLEFISGFLVKKCLKKSNFCTEPGKKLPKNLRSLKI